MSTRCERALLFGDHDEDAVRVRVPAAVRGGRFS